MTWRQIIVVGVVVICLAGCAPGASESRPAVPASAGAAAAPPGPPTPATAAARPANPPPLIPVKVSDIPNVSNAGVYIALDRGYFREAGLDVSLEIFDVTERAIPALATNQVDVGAGGINA